MSESESVEASPASEPQEDLSQVSLREVCEANKAKMTDEDYALSQWVVENLKRGIRRNAAELAAQANQPDAEPE